MKNKKSVSLKKKIILLVLGGIIIFCMLATYKHYHEAMIEKRVIRTYGQCIDVSNDPGGYYERAYCYCNANYDVREKGFNPDEENYKAWRSYKHMRGNNVMETSVSECMIERLKFLGI